MEQYELFYKSILIGHLSVFDGKHMYVPRESGVQLVGSGAPLSKEMREGTNGFTDPLPFFQNRLFNMKRWGLTKINYQTDYCTLTKVDTQ